MVSGVSRFPLCAVRGFYLELADVFNPSWEVCMVEKQEIGRVLCVYSLFDRKLREYGPLVVERNDEAVIRSLTDGVRGSKSLMEMHPEDFDLFFVGSFNTASGVVVGASGESFAPRLVGNLRDFLFPALQLEDGK